MIQIRYSKKLLNHYLNMGLFFIGLGTILLIINYVWLPVATYLSTLAVPNILNGIGLLLFHNFARKKQYISIANGQLTKHSLFPKTIALANIRAISETAGIYTIASTQGKMSINSKLMDPDSRLTLRKELEKLKAVTL